MSGPSTKLEQTPSVVGPQLDIRVTQRLSTVDVLPELRRMLVRLSEADQRWSVERWPWGWVIPAVRAALDSTVISVDHFQAAWTVMYAAIVRLDQLQDGDAVDDPLPAPLPDVVHYNLLLSYYILAESLLDNLAEERIPAHRVLRVKRLWSDMMLRTASGQQRDLSIAGESGHPMLDEYEQIARAKTGSTFALAFGGVATLVTDDQELVDACLTLGDLFGALVQYHDDILDAASQPNATLTLPVALARALPEIATQGRSPQDFWAYVYQAYRRYAEHVVAGVPEPIGAALLDVFTRAFENSGDAHELARAN